MTRRGAVLCPENAMNYLMHLYLSDPHPDCLLGNLMGDFVKGRLDDRFPAEIRRGLCQHRRIDSYAHTHEAFRCSKGRLNSAYGHGRGILVDIFYDHFLARNWPQLSPIPLETFTQNVYLLLRQNHHSLPPGLQRIAPRMIEHDWLVSYRDLGVIGRVLERIATRLNRPIPLEEALKDLKQHYEGLEEDFFRFAREARIFLEQDSSC